MYLTSKKIRQSNRNLAILLMIPTAIVAKIIYIFFLPPKYFFDSLRMVSMMNGSGVMTAWGGYQDAVDFHSSINILQLTNINQFSIWYGLIMTPVMMFIVSKTKEMEMREVLFTLMATGVLNIYVFNINKEMIQFLYFFAIYVVISLPIKNTFIKVLGCSIIYYLESINFRSYYIIMAFMTILVYFIFLWLGKRELIKRRHIVITVLLCFVGVFVFFYISQFISYDDYVEALNVRDGTAISVDEAGAAASAIYNPIEVNSNLGIFAFDYVINAVRMMVPIELIFKSPAYAPFFIYQIFILFYLFRTMKNIRNIDRKMLVVLSAFVAYFFGSVVFEPDFGSWVRHEATTFPILQLLAYRSKNYQKNESKESNAYERAFI